MNVVIFGGSGFIGTHYSQYLIGQGHHVFCVDICKPRFESQSLTYIKHDVRDLSCFELDDSIHVIFNFAAIHTTPGHDYFEYYETNILGAVEVCNFATRNNVPEIVFTSSISVYGTSEDERNEDSKLNPNSAYGYSKVAAERIHLDWQKREKKKLTIIRPAVVFGYGEGGNFTRLAKVLKSGYFIYPGRKDTIKSCIYVKDLIHLIEVSRGSHLSKLILNGAYTERYTLENIIDSFKEVKFKNVKTFLFPSFFVYSMAKILRVFNIFNLGIHPERVEKLIRSTNIYPNYVKNNLIEFPYNLDKALIDWALDSHEKFN